MEHTNHFWLSTLTLISVFFLLEHPLHFPNLSEPLPLSFPAYPIFRIPEAEFTPSSHFELWALVEAGATQGQRKQECKIHRQTSKHCPFHRYIRDKFLVLLPFLCFCCWNMPKPPSITFQRLIPQQMKAGPPTAHFF